MWIANLSNGENVNETDPIPGERSSWQKLLEKCRVENIHITGLRLALGNIKITALPQKSCRAYFQAREMRRVLLRGSSMETGADQHLQGIGSVVGEEVFITWILLNPPDNSIYIEHDVRPLEACLVHTTLDTEALWQKQTSPPS